MIISNSSQIHALKPDEVELAGSRLAHHPVLAGAFTLEIADLHSGAIRLLVVARTQAHPRNIRLALAPCLRATSATDAPGWAASATIARIARLREVAYGDFSAVEVTSSNIRFETLACGDESAAVRSDAIRQLSALQTIGQSNREGTVEGISEMFRSLRNASGVSGLARKHLRSRQTL